MSKKTCYWLSTPVLQKIKIQRSKVQFSLIAQLFLWDQCHFCSIAKLSWIQFDWNTVQLGVINYSRIYLIKSCIFAFIIEMKRFVSCYRFNTMYTKHARKFWSPPPMWVSECIHTPLHRREYLFLTVACLPFWGRQVTVRNTSAFTV